MKMAASVDCPESGCWRALFGDDIAAEQRESYEQHLEACPVCQQRLDQSEEFGGPLLCLVRSIGGAASTSEPALQGVMEKLHDIRSSTPTTEEGTDLYFLRSSERAD